MTRDSFLKWSYFPIIPHRLQATNERPWMGFSGTYCQYFPSLRHYHVRADFIHMPQLVLFLCWMRLNPCHFSYSLFSKPLSVANSAQTFVIRTHVVGCSKRGFLQPFILQKSTVSPSIHPRIDAFGKTRLIPLQGALFPKRC